MQQHTTDKSSGSLYKAFLTAAMLCAIAMATVAAVPNIAFAHGGGGGGGDGGRDGEPAPQETVEEDKTVQKNQQKLFWSKQKMSKAYNKLIRHQEHMKTKLHSPETYNYSSQQLVADIKEEDKLQKELAACQEEVKNICDDLDVKPPADAMLVRPSVLGPAEITAMSHLKSEETLIDTFIRKQNEGSSFEVQTADVIAGTNDANHKENPGDVYSPPVYSTQEANWGIDAKNCDPADLMW
ncbi:MAG: hypothetical protein IKT09_00680 [Synergistes sp.]|nr:hypothetical protein [Synergistes sp.]